MSGSPFKKDLNLKIQYLLIVSQKITLKRKPIKFKKISFKRDFVKGIQAHEITKFINKNY